MDKAKQPKPNAGGSYSRDPETGELKKIPLKRKTAKAKKTETVEKPDSVKKFLSGGTLDN